MDKKKELFMIWAASVLLYAMICWVNGYGSVYLSMWAYSLAYYAIAWYWLHKDEESLGAVPVATAVTIGGLTIDVPLRIMDYVGTSHSLMLPLMIVVDVILATMCYKEKRTSVYFLSFVVILLLNTVVLTDWLEFSQVRYMRK